MNVHGSDFQCDSPDNVSDHLHVSVTVFCPIMVILTLLILLRVPFHGMMNGSSSFTLHCMAVGRMAQVRFSVVRILLTECTVWPNLYNLCHFSQLSSEI